MGAEAVKAAMLCYRDVALLKQWFIAVPSKKHDGNDLWAVRYSSSWYHVTIELVICN